MIRTVCMLVRFNHIKCAEFTVVSNTLATCYGSFHWYAPGCLNGLVLVKVILHELETFVSIGVLGGRAV